MKLILLLLIYFPLTALSEPVRFIAEVKPQSSTGYHTLEWSNENKKEIKVEQASSNTFLSSKVVYLGKGSSVFLSGLLDGDYYFRIFVADKKIPGIVHLKVKQKSKFLAFTIFLSGLSAFILIVYVILRGEYAN